jgi:polyisoprenyl-phosphate glycosyltransferase
MKISIVVPVYNASKVLFELRERIESALTGSGHTYEIIFVDDYSTNDSWKIIKELKKNYPGIVVGIRFAKNFGQHNAIFCGLHYCTGDFIVTVDDDLQNPPEEIMKLIECQENTGADIVYGISTTYQRPLLRRVTSNLFKFSSKVTSNSRGGSSFRLLKKELVKKLISHNQYFVFLDELVAWYTSNMEFITVRHDKSRVGKSRYTGSKLLKLYNNLLIGYNASPLKSITYVGILSSIVSFLVGVFFLIKKIFFDVRIGFTGIIVSVTFTASILLLSIGIIGEYLRKVYFLLNAQPQYFVSEELLLPEK